MNQMVRMYTGKELEAHFPNGEVWRRNSMTEAKFPFYCRVVKEAARLGIRVDRDISWLSSLQIPDEIEGWWRIDMPVKPFGDQEGSTRTWRGSIPLVQAMLMEIIYYHPLTDKAIKGRYNGFSYEVIENGLPTGDWVVDVAHFRRLLLETIRTTRVRKWL